MRITVKLDSDLARHVRAVRRQHGFTTSRAVRELMRLGAGMPSFDRGWHEGLMAGRAAFERAQHAALSAAATEIGMGGRHPDVDSGT